MEAGNTWLAVAMRNHRWAHAPMIFLLLGMMGLILASARPQAVLMTPQRVDAVMLLDISGSMRADDVSPSRIDAAKNAIRRFISKQPASLKVGLVTVASTATMVQMPTLKRDALLTAIDGVALQPGSALGAGIAVALTGLLPQGSVPLQSILDGTFQVTDLSKIPAKPRDSVAIVLLSDGADNMAPDIRSMARLASSSGVRVYTVGIGTTQGAVLRAQGMSMRVRLEEEELKFLAAETTADYFSASSSDELHRIYDTMGRTIVFRQDKQTEITAVFLLLSVVTFAAGATLGLVRSGRIL
jgi:Ca-activated chloride channel family protein